MYRTTSLFERAVLDGERTNISMQGQLATLETSCRDSSMHAISKLVE
jgi:hypothetical protein